MDEAMKRIPREGLEAQIRMHPQANYTMIRNWVGQSTSDDFYDLCDKYGIMLWDEFFQPNPVTARTRRIWKPIWPIVGKKSSAFAIILPSPSGAVPTKGVRPKTSTTACRN